MSTAMLLPGITQRTLKTDRLTIAYLEVGAGDVPIVLVHGNCSSSLFFQDLMLALAAKVRYKLYALDMRGYGASELQPVDATRGVRDFSDDLATFVQALNLPPFHLLGWSLGGNVVMQYAIDYPGKVRTLTLEATGSPYGFGGTRDTNGTPTWPDYAGSGGGIVNLEYVERLRQGDRGNDASSPRSVMNNIYFKPPFRVASDREEIYVSAILSTKISPGNYPGDTTPSEHWPHVAPGVLGVNNALSPKYLQQGSLALSEAKPPILWIHGTDDRVVSDTSMLDLGFLGSVGLVPGWPGNDVYPPQPMKAQVRAVLDQYRDQGGSYQEVALPDCGHSPHIEKQDEVVSLISTFIHSQ